MPHVGSAIPFQIVALGASNTAGYGVGQDQAYPAVLETLLSARGMNVSVQNAGISGNTTGEMLARLDQAVPSGTRVVILQPGSNDRRRGIPDAVRDGNIATIQSILERRGIAVVRVAAAFEMARVGNLQPDGIHYTAAGHAVIASLLVDQVAALLNA